MAVKFSDFSVGTLGTDLEMVGYDLTTPQNVKVSYTDLKNDILGSAVTGSGVTGQVSYWNGTNSQAGSNNLFWNSANNRLGIGLTNPQRSLEVYSATADSHVRLSGSAPSVSMGDAITGALYQAKFALATANGQFATGSSAGDFIILSQTGANIFMTNATERMRLTAAGRLLLGTTTESTFILDAVSDARINGLTVGKGGGSIFTNTAFGTTALNVNTTGIFNVALGTEALFSNLTGSYNVAIGTYSLQIATAASANIAIGHNSIANVSNPGVQNIGIGVNTLYKSTGGRNVAIGYLTSGNITSAEYSTAVGWGALGVNTSGLRNTAIGASSLQSATTGGFNIALGQSSGYNITTGSNNIMIGSELGGVSTGSNNTIIGSNILPAQLSASLANNIILADGSGNMRLAINNSGDVYIGGSTTYPTFAGYKLDVNGTARIDGFKIGGTYGTPPSLFANSTLGAIIQGNVAATTFSITLFGNSGSAGLFLNSTGQVKIGEYTSTYNSSAILEAVSTTKGFLPPRMTTAQKNAIGTPAAGLVVYDTDLSKLCVFTTAWQTITSV